jgi:DNA repair protein RadC
MFYAPTQAKQYVQQQLGGRSFEVFAVLFLDAQNRLLRLEEMFRGTLTQTSVYPREVVKRAHELQAAAVILAHNHPSGVAEPSRADEFLTQTLKSALQLVDVRVLDHLVVGQGAVVSFAEWGLL